MADADFVSVAAAEAAEADSDVRVYPSEVDSRRGSPLPPTRLVETVVSERLAGLLGLRVGRCRRGRHGRSGRYCRPERGGPPGSALPLASPPLLETCLSWRPRRAPRPSLRPPGPIGTLASTRARRATGFTAPANAAYASPDGRLGDARRTPRTSLPPRPPPPIGTPASTRAWRPRRAGVLPAHTLKLHANAFSDLQNFIFTMNYHTRAEAA